MNYETTAVHLADELKVTQKFQWFDLIKEALEDAYLDGVADGRSFDESRLER